jgi:alkylation response protein AidB-like acyl-CoA dehydrogenase
MDFTLSTDQQRWVELAKELGPAFASRAREYDEAAAFPEKDFELLKEHGFLALAVPKAFGGHGEPAGYAALLPYMVVKTIASFSSGTAWCLMIHYHQSGVIARLGDDEQRHRILGDVAQSGALLGSSGSEVNPRQLTAAKDQATKLTFDKAEIAATDGGLIANGTKFFCSGAPVAKYLLYWGLAPGTVSSGEGLFQAVIPAKNPGITFDSNGWEESTGLRCTMTWSTKFEDVFIPWENVLGQPGDFVQKDPYTYELSQSAHLLGSAEGAFNFVMTVLRERPYLLSDDNLVFDVGEIDAALQACNASLLYSNWLWEQERWSEAALASVRTLHSVKEVAGFITQKGYEIIGTRALFKYHPFERAARDMHAAMSHTRESQLMRLLVEGTLEGNYWPKKKYGEKLDGQKTWEELGLRPTPESITPG